MINRKRKRLPEGSAVCTAPDMPARWMAAGSLVVAIIAVAISALQLSNERRQTSIQQAQARPKVREYPYFYDRGGQITIQWRGENLGSLPAQVIFSDLLPALDWHRLNNDVHSTGTDLLYPGKNAGAFLPPIPAQESRALGNGDQTLEIGVCVIYRSADLNSPTWQMTGVYEFAPGDGEPTDLFLSDAEVPNDTSKCSPEQQMREQAAQRLKVL